MSTYLITGTNRGIGLEFLKQVAANPENTVIAVVRDESRFQAVEDLKLKNVKLIALDMAATLEEFHEKLSVLKEWGPIDVVIHNAGVVPKTIFSAIIDHQFSEYERLAQVNYFGTVKLYRAVYPYLAKPLKFVYISTVASSIAGMFAPTNSYGASKAAANYFIKQVSVERKGDIVIPIHPGGVDTDGMRSCDLETTSDFFNDFFKEMDTPELISTEESVTKMLDLLAKLKPEDSGKFWNYDGTELPF